MSPYSASSRTVLAATALGVSSDGQELVSAVCAFRGYPAPGDGLAAHLVVQAFAALDRVPLDVRLYIHVSSGSA